MPRDSLFPFHYNHLDVCVVPSAFPLHHPSFHGSCFPRQGLQARPRLPSWGTRRAPPPRRSAWLQGPQPLYSASQQESRRNPHGAAHSPWPGTPEPPTSASVLAALVPGLLMERVFASWVCSTSPRSSPHPWSHRLLCNTHPLPQPLPCSSPRRQGPAAWGYCGGALPARVRTLWSLEPGSAVEWVWIWHPSALLAQRPGEQGGSGLLGLAGW